MSDVLIDYLMKKKRNNQGDYDILYPITSGKNVKLKESIAVTGTRIGALQSDRTIPANTSIEDILKMILQTRINPTYTAPTLSLSAAGTNAGSYEAGTSCSPTLTSRFTINDAGAITSHIIKKGSTVLETTTDSTATYSDSFTLGASNVSYTSTCSYAAGAVKKDNLGEDNATGQITAGTKSSNTVTFSTFRKYFYGCTDTATAAINTSADVRLLTNSTSAASNGKVINITVPLGTTRVTFAYVASLRDVSSVKYVENSNSETKGSFEKTIVSVEGANGYEAVDYKVYTCIMASGAPAAMTFAVTI